MRKLTYPLKNTDYDRSEVERNSNANGRVDGVHSRTNGVGRYFLSFYLTLVYYSHNKGFYE